MLEKIRGTDRGFGYWMTLGSPEKVLGCDLNFGQASMLSIIEKGSANGSVNVNVSVSGGEILYRIVVGVNVEDGLSEYPFPMHPARKVGIDDIKRGLCSHCVGQSLRVRKRYSKRNPKIILPLCQRMTGSISQRSRDP